jgi:hypothetical protein
LADEDKTARKALFSDLRVQLSTIVFALRPPFAQVGLKGIHDARAADLVPPPWWRICSSQPGHGFPAQADALGNSSVAVSLGLERLDLFVACPLTVRAGLLFTLHPHLAEAGDMATDTCYLPTECSRCRARSQAVSGLERLTGETDVGG